MKYLEKLVNPMLLFFVVASASFFYSERAAIDDSLRYRPLANGWVSIYATIQMDESLTVLEKIKRSIEEDMVHGRFRPAFFFYTTMSYALSPIIHGKIRSGEDRKYTALMTGDQRIFSYMLILSLVTAACLMGSLVYSYVGSKIFILLPLVFIPFSPAVTENLLQNYIDSQEIPLVLWIALWLYFLFKTLHHDPLKRMAINTYFSFSLIFFVIAFLTKETMIVVTFPLLILTFFIIQKKYYSQSYKVTYQEKCIISTFVLSIVCAVGIIFFVSAHKQGYATAYQVVNFEVIKSALKELWSCVSIFSLHNIYGFLPIGISLLILFLQRGKLLNGKTVSQHLAFVLFMLAISYGFLFILTPWTPILAKYVLPSVFFFSFLVAYSLGIIFIWLRIYDKKILNIFAYGLLLPYLFLFAGMHGNAAGYRDHLFGFANYGVETLDAVVDDIDKEFNDNDTIDHKVFVGLEAGGTWTHHIYWSTLHLKRMLNFDKGFNLNDFEGRPIRNTAMPQEELTSFIHSPNRKSLFLSENQNDLKTIGFNIVYQAFLEGTVVPESLNFGSTHYINVGKIVENQIIIPFLVFRIYKFLPAETKY